MMPRFSPIMAVRSWAPNLKRMFLTRDLTVSFRDRKPIGDLLIAIARRNQGQNADFRRREGFIGGVLGNLVSSL